MEPLEGIAAADARLGRPVPLPAIPLPLTRWVEVRAVGDAEADGVEVEWNLDDSRSGTPGRLALYAGTTPPPPREWDERPEEITIAGRPATLFITPLTHAQPSLRPVHELRWQQAGLHLRLTAQGPWSREGLMAVAESIGR